MINYCDKDLISILAHNSNEKQNSYSKSCATVNISNIIFFKLKDSILDYYY